MSRPARERRRVQKQGVEASDTSDSSAGGGDSGGAREQGNGNGAANGKRKKMPKMQKGGEALWLAPDLSKRWGELFFLAYSLFWITLCLGIVVPLQLYEKYQELEYLILGLVCAVPAFTVPIFLVGKEDAERPWYRRYWVKANIWIFIFGFVGNYFWTHYFYTVLGATFSFPSYKLNYVPVTSYLLTQGYFLFYHVASNLTIRRLHNAVRGLKSTAVKFLLEALWVFVLSYLTAFMEAVTIANFPYYEMVDRAAMYKFGSLFYAIYFFVSFPMFFSVSFISPGQEKIRQARYVGIHCWFVYGKIDEDPQKPSSIGQAAVNSLAAAMLVTIILDLWRIIIGPIVEIPWGASLEQCASFGLPWLQNSTAGIYTKAS